MRHLLTGICLFMILLLPRQTAGQCSSLQERPDWVDGYFYDRNSSYIESVTATGPTENEARNNAAQSVIERRNLASGQRVRVQVQNGSFVVSGDGELTVKARILDEYIEHCGAGQYRVSLLVQTAKNPTFELERVNVTDSYPFSPRVFAPGMAQLHKGSTAKGITFIAGEVALIGGVVVSEGMRTSYESKIGSTHNAASRQSYIDNASTMQNVRNICIAGAVALYAWNVIDGVVAKGKKHVMLGGNLRFTPYLFPQSNGVALSYKF